MRHLVQGVRVDPVEALQRLGGVAGLGELLGPTTRRQVDKAVSDERIVRIRRNRYALVDIHESRRTAVSVGGTVSHLSAAQRWGWKVQHPPLKVCVTLPRSARRPAGDLDLHWQDLDDSDVINHVTRRVPTVTACSRAYEFGVALCVADSALREGEVTRAELILDAERSPRTGRAKALRVAEAADGRAANPFESALRAIVLTVPGLCVVPQGKVKGVGFVDLLDRRLGIVIEAESFEFHGKLSGLQRDVARYTACARRGLVVVRFTWDEVMFDPEYVREALSDVVAWRTRQAVGRVA